MFRPVPTMMLAAALLASTAAVSAAQRPVAAAALNVHDALTAIALRAMLEDLVGDSADSVCVAVADSTKDPRTGDLAEHDPSPAVLSSLRGGTVTAIPASACAADERDGGPFRGVLRVNDVSAVSDSTLVAHAEAIAEHRARYECVVPRKAGTRAQCRVTDLP